MRDSTVITPADGIEEQARREHASLADRAGESPELRIEQCGHATAAITLEGDDAGQWLQDVLDATGASLTNDLTVMAEEDFATGASALVVAL